ncbi:apoptosis regulator Bcl-2 [Caerostris extrusa]|uniref:Apoptosis regulator Bcl-2 n=1 Tax=Caerostris extrusa TaxID=172846 RepID=A0AAV4R6C1_CAEEX|nr:apoptosis regulator Bcl-2 [Caerostris extrusa]
MEDSGQRNSRTELSQNGDGSSIDPAVAVFVSEFLQYKLSLCGYQWTSPLITSRAVGNRSIAVQVGIALRSLADDFASQFKEQFDEMCDKLNITAGNLKPTIEGVADELFSEGIKWARIVAFFVFGSELAVHCRNKNCFDLINLIAYSQSTYITEKLLPWINDHGGWEGLILFKEGESTEKEPSNRWPSAKNLLCLGIGALGAITIGAVFTKS